MLPPEGRDIFILDFVLVSRITETANFKHTREQDDEGSRPSVGVNCSYFSLCRALGGAQWSEESRTVPPIFLIVMKKGLLSLVAFVFATACAVAQGSLLATLSHEGYITTFYGAQAWRLAHDAAVHGDVITLSSGTFVATDITKAVTVRGAGMGIDTAAVTEPTVISGDFKINIADSGTSRLTLEGIYSNHTVSYVNVKNPLFLKCRFNAVTYTASTSILKDANFIHCRVAGNFNLASNSSALCMSSVISQPYTANYQTSNFEFLNCVVVDYYPINLII